MTLSRGPYSELDKMSLFQDLKLKRRKIDSRCSSDGESVADTSTSSPDLLAPMSPKMCDSGGGAMGVGIGSSSIACSLVTLTATSSVTTTTTPATCSSTALPQHQVAAEVVVATAKAVAAAVAVKGEHMQLQQQQQKQTDTHASCGMTASSPANIMMTPPAPVRSTPPINNEMTDSSDRRASMCNRATPTPPHNNGNASSSTSNGGGSCRASPDSMDDKPVTTTTSSTLPPNGNHATMGGSNISNPNSNLSVIRSVKEERILASPNRMMAYHQQQQQGSKTPAQSQHVTVLVTPSRIKSESQLPQQTSNLPYSTAVSVSTTTASPSSSGHCIPTTSHQPAPNQQPHHQQQQYLAPTPVPPIVTTHHLHQQLTQPQLRKNSPPHDLQLPSHHHLLTQSMQHLTQQQQLHLLQQAAAMSRQNNPTSRELSPSASMSPSSRHSSSKSPQHHMMQPQQNSGQHVRIKKEPPSMQNHVSGFGNSGNGPQRHHSPHYMQQQSPNQQQQQSQQAPPPPQALGNMAQALMHPSSLQSLRHPNRDAAILFRVKNEVQQHVAAAAAAAAGLPQLMQPGAAAVAAAAAQRMVWVSNARINGVKPEVIGGPMGSIRPGGPAQSPSPHHSSSSASSSSQLSPQTPSQTPPRGTPTVIMGESCGVRTMVWGYEPAAPSSSAGSQSQSPNSHLHAQHHVQHQQMGGGGPPPSLQSQSHHSSQSSLNTASSPSAGSLTPTHTPGPSPQNNEEAAQLLLSLGQTRIQDNRPRPPHAFRTPHALNMERLWAGDYSQLPPGQLHALNLSAAQQPWGGGGTSNTTGLGRGLDNPHEPTDEDDQPLVCMICEDKATGLHYGIITCEG